MARMKSDMSINQLRKARRRIEELSNKQANILRVDDLIKERGISRMLLSNITGISPSRIDTFARNSFKNITAEEICILAAFFNIPVRQLFRNKKTIVRTQAAYMRDIF